MVQELGLRVIIEDVNILPSQSGWIHSALIVKHGDRKREEFCDKSGGFSFLNKIGRCVTSLSA